MSRQLIGDIKQSQDQFRIWSRISLPKIKIEEVIVRYMCCRFTAIIWPIAIFEMHSPANSREEVLQSVDASSRAFVESFEPTFNDERVLPAALA